MAKHAEQPVEYRCPGKSYPISRAVHLGRLARFYPGCRQCLHRDDTGTLSARQVEQLVETRLRGRPQSLFFDEGAEGVYLNELDPAAAHGMAAAFGVTLQHHIADGVASHSRPPVVALAGDGRPASCELLAAVAEGLRWAGCHLLDIGPATSACLAFAIDHLGCTGGMLVGNPGEKPHAVGLTFWDDSSGPISAGGPLEQLKQVYQTGVDRPTRTYGSLRRFQAEVPYLAGLAGYYHALRPLRLVLDTRCGPLVGYFEKLIEPTACRIIPRRTTTDRLCEQAGADEAHFAVCIDGSGETCRVLDEQGRRVQPERLLLLLARHRLAEDPQAVVVLEEGTSPAVAQAIGGTGATVVLADSRRSEMATTMCRHGARFGGGPSGRFWYADGHPPLPDALMTLTLLLVLLSRSDRHLSEVLDREAAPG